MDIKTRNKKQNDWQKENKWRPNIALPKTYEKAVKERAKEITKGNVNGYIKKLIDEDIDPRFSNGGGA